MSSRWFARTMFFNRNSSFQDSSTFDTDLNKSLRQLECTNSYPVLCWIEKLLLLVDFLQLFSILWIAAQPWPWPYLWTITTRPLLYVNLDFFSMTEKGALAGKSSSIGTSKWGSMENYLNYSLGFAIAQFCVFSSIFLVKYWYTKYGKAAVAYRNELIGIALLTSHVIYLPCCLAVFRLYHCNSHNQLSADPDVECFGISHTIYFVVCTALMLPVLVGLPVLTHQFVSASLIYRNSNDHEKRLQLWELQHMLSLNDYWASEQVWLLSSFKRRSAYFRVHMLLFKLLLLALFIFIRFDLLLQAVLFCIFTALFGLYHTLTRYPYRAMSSNVVMVAVLSMMVVNTTFGMVNAFGVKSAVMVASTETLVLGSFNVFALLVIALVFLYLAVQEVLDWPTLRTLHRITHNKELIPKAARWIETMREAQEAKMAFLLAPLEVADINGLEETIRQLRSCWLSARSCGSIFETAVGEVLEDLIFTHSKYLPYALRKYPFWNAAYEEGVRSGVFARRARQMKMMAPKKRRLLLKLLAFRFVKGDRCSFDMDIALAHNQEQLVLQQQAEAKKELRRQKQQQKRSKSRFQFQTFAANAKGFLFNNGSNRSRPGSDKSRKLSPESSATKLLDREDDAERGVGGSGREEGDEEGQQVLGADEEEEELVGLARFDPQDVEEATKMIRRLHERTELALNKHHNAKKSLTLQNILSQQPTSQGSSSSHLHGQSTGGILNKISTMDLIEETVDVEEQQDLEELYLLWDEAIQLYELEDFPGDYEQLNKEAENWYTYRGLVSERLEIVVQTLERNKFDNEIEGQEVIEEGEDDEEQEGMGEEQDEENQRRPLLSKKLSYS